VLAFASIATVINALIRLCCFILLIPSWEGKMPIPERSKNSRGTSYPRGLERECLTWRCRIEKGQRLCRPQYKAEHMAYGDGPRLARVLDSVLIGSLAVICPAFHCSRTGPLAKMASAL
jgi:hypothetical protein